MATLWSRGCIPKYTAWKFIRFLWTKKQNSFPIRHNICNSCTTKWESMNFSTTHSWKMRFACTSTLAKRTGKKFPTSKIKSGNGSETAKYFFALCQKASSRNSSSITTWLKRKRERSLWKKESKIMAPCSGFLSTDLSVGHSSSSLLITLSTQSIEIKRILDTKSCLISTK